MDRFCLEIRPFGNYCPHSCNFCYQKKGKKACSTMSLNTSIKALKCTLDYMSLHSLKELKLVFHGGEPAHDGGSLIFEIVDNARKIFDKKTQQRIAKGRAVLSRDGRRLRGLLSASALLQGTAEPRGTADRQTLERQEAPPGFPPKSPPPQP